MGLRLRKLPEFPDPGFSGEKAAGRDSEILDRLSVPPARATYVCELYHDKNWERKGTALPVQLADWRGGPGCAAGENGSGWGPLIERPGAPGAGA